MDSRICAIITAKGIEAASAQVWKAKALGAGIVELRMDLIGEKSGGVGKLVSTAHAIGLSCIVTYRDRKEGGKFNGSDREKQACILDAIAAGADYVDVELSSAKIIGAAKGAARRAGCKIIASWHDFGGQPEVAAMEWKIRQAKQAGADVVKIAFEAEGGERCANAVDALTETAGKEGIAIIASPMGRNAAAARAHALKAGSAFAYCALDGKQSAALGAPPVARLREALAKQNR